MKKKDVIIGLVIAVTLAIFSFLASASPDGLERVAEDKSFLDKAVSLIRAPIADYMFPGVNNEKLAGSIAGVVGVFIVFISALILGRLLGRKNETRLFR